MYGKPRILGLAGASVLLGLLAGCTGGGDASGTAAAAKAQPARESVLTAGSQPVRRIGFATLPDRGELLAYTDRKGVRQRGAYTWYPVSLSEDHALRAIATGEMRVRSPEGGTIALKYERHVEHPDGNWSWIGRTADGRDAVLTFGEAAVFGSIPNGAGLPLRLTMQGGRSYLVEVDASRIANINIEATRPTRPDTLKPPLAPRLRVVTPFTTAAAQMATADPNAASVVDVAVGYTNGFATSVGGQSAAVTRINNLVDTTNQAYANSQVNARVRLVHTMQVTYADATDNNVALEELTGYRNGSSIPVPAALQPLRAARETYGADLVSLVRDFRTPENQGCGVAWILGFQQQPIDQSWSDFGYSVVSDGSDFDESDDSNYFCREETFAHELGHNMGSAHDRETSKGDNGVLDPDEYGRYPYSFGHNTSVGNFFTVMAYGDSGQTSYRVFSNPRITFCGGQACGVTDQADNARSLSQTIPIIASFREEIPVEDDEEDNAPRPVAAGNFNGDGKYDIFWRHGGDGGNAIWRSASSGTQTAVRAVTDVRWQVVATGDFNGDGRSDVAWRHRTSGKGAIWLSGDAATQQSLTTVSDQAWQVAGAGDFNRDGRADLVWRNASSGKNAIWLSGKSGTQQSLASLTDTRWRIAGIGDFNGDGRADILWRHSTNGRDVIWLSGNPETQQTTPSVTDLAWQIVGIGDFDGDGRDDVLWRHAGNGRDTIWLSGNGNTQRAVTGVTDRNWRVASVGDFDGDGHADILWRHAVSGRNVIWRSADSTSQQAVTKVADLAWAVAG